MGQERCHGQGDTSLSKSLSVLLASASSGGTIAAVRHLGANGFDVRVISSHRLGAAAWSRYAARAYSAPPESESQRFLERLLAIGAADPGQILLPTSDETAWLYTVNAAELGAIFLHLSTLDRGSAEYPRQEAFCGCRDQRRARCVAELGSAKHRRSRGVGADLALSDPYKAAHACPPPQERQGGRCLFGSELIDQYQRFVDREQARAADNPLLPDASLPILQQFVSVGSEGVHSVTGFIDRTGELFVTRRATKVFQRSQPVGVGVCFESLPPAPRCRMPFAASVESSVISGSSRSNFSGSTGVGRQSTSTRACLIRSGWTSAAACHFRFSPASTPRAKPQPCAMQWRRRRRSSDEQAVFCDRFTLRAILLAQTMTSRISPEDRAYWRAWIKQNAAHTVDVAADEQRPDSRGHPRALGDLSGPQVPSTLFALDAARFPQTPHCAYKGAVVSKIAVAIIGAGPYGLSLAAHLAARNVKHRIFGRPMQFWSEIAEAGGERYLKSYCFGTNISTPTPGFSFADYSEPRGLETFEPCSIGDFAAYGHWFQQSERALGRAGRRDACGSDSPTVLRSRSPMASALSQTAW